jgi:parallel beta-helix repeat protein
MKKKWLAVGIILLFVGVTIAPSIAQDIEKSQTSRGNWLYVGGSGPGNYSRIQDAVDNALEGDTVFVYDDSSPYYENVVVNNRIMLVGEDRNTTVIDAGGHGTVIEVDAFYVTIRGFTIQNCGEGDEGIKVIYGTIMTGNIIINNSYGIYCSSIDFVGLNIISENIIINNRVGICLDVSYNNEVYGNYIENNSESGIYVGSIYVPLEHIKQTLDEYSNNIYGNIIIRNGGCGIYMPWAEYTNVFENEITHNNVGIYIDAPYFTSCCYNNIYQNHIHNNNYGIVAVTYYKYGIVGYNNISKNSLVNNSNGVYLLGKVTRNTFSNNNFIGNNRAVYFEYESFLNGNYWVNNYWEKTRRLPYLIKGKVSLFLFCIPWRNFDWHPAQEPYDIPGMS